MHNKIAWKLTSYFSVILLVFAIVVGGSFAYFFKARIVEMKKDELSRRAVRIAEVLSETERNFKQRSGTFSNSRFIGYIDNITVEAVWLIDEERTLKIPERKHAWHSEHVRPVPKKTVAQELAPSGPPDFGRLPTATKAAVERAFKGEVAASEDYNTVLEDVVLSAAAPVRDAQTGRITSVVLLHYPLQGLKEAGWEGIRILLLSCVIALISAMILSVLFSWRFTRPLNRMKAVAQKMAEHDYTERCGISQNDEIGALADTMDGLNQRLLEADESGRKLEKLRRSFIANISHELRTPVTVIRGSLEALCDKVVSEPAEIEQYHKQMLSESIFLQRLINDLLDLSRLQNADFAIEKAITNLCDVINDVAHGCKHLCPEKDLKITTELDRGIYLLEGDYGRLRQMLMIFLDNSIKFSANGGSVRIILRGNRLVVKDQGVGINPGDLPYVFDRFYKARSETNKVGTGLGLAIAKEIAQRHGIRLSMESAQGEGTSVVMLLPPALPEQEVEA